MILREGKCKQIFDDIPGMLYQMPSLSDIASFRIAKAFLTEGND